MDIVDFKLLVTNFGTVTSTLGEKSIWLLLVWMDK